MVRIWCAVAHNINLLACHSACSSPRRPSVVLGPWLRQSIMTLTVTGADWSIRTMDSCLLSLMQISLIFIIRIIIRTCIIPPSHHTNNKQPKKRAIWPHRLWYSSTYALMLIRLVGLIRHSRWQTGKHTKILIVLLALEYNVRPIYWYKLEWLDWISLHWYRDWVSS